jgi:hypothetical protein
MRPTRKLLAIAIALFASLTAGRNLEAQVQRCGADCEPCEGAPSQWVQGGGSQTGAKYLLYCVPGSSCTKCDAGPVTLRDQVQPVTNTMLASLRSGSRDQFSELVRSHAETLRYSSRLGAIVVLGGCDGKTVQTVLRLNQSQRSWLAGLGLQTFEAHLAALRQAQSSERRG